MTNILYSAFNGCNNTAKILLDKIDINPENKLYLKNSFTSSVIDLKKKIINNKYDLIICFGQWQIVTQNTLRIETMSTSLEDAQEKILTTFDYKTFCHYLEENNIQYKISKNAGDYLCNYIYYHGLKIINDNNLKTKMLFIHLPKIKKINCLDEVAQVFTNYNDK